MAGEDVIGMGNPLYNLNQPPPPEPANFTKALWKSSRRQDVMDTRFSEFSRLHRVNILRLESELIRWKSPDDAEPDDDQYVDPKIPSTALRSLTVLLREYTQAVQDFDYFHNLREVNRDLADKERRDREGEFGEFLSTEIPTPNKTLPKHDGSQSDLMLNWIREHLWKTLAWSRKERKDRLNAFVTGEKPDQFSLPTRLLTSMIIALGAGIFFVVPTVLLTIPKTVSRAWDLSTISVAILIFGACAALFFGPEPNTKDVVASTAAYAAVLVVFYGNLINNEQQQSNSN
ncbi:hypothetical protein BCR34DRAFT_596280 [Clohesyomyces aquaticus]|uniref:DUF6594 domain-containing protein n=1 Tax=Clohesyomyces aquaticus TaxID=1231657 RepID=A0A1Y2A732_9PLEO|nr:hypothetical protein BCR34DRAFT_596280 [Clohesyomyces aquaticus]